MSKGWIAAAALFMAATATVPAAARSDDEEPNVTPRESTQRDGLDFGIRTGYAIPLSKRDRSGGSALGEQIYGAVPVVLELAIHANPHFSIGSIFQYGFAQAKDVHSSASTIHLGLEALLYPRTQGDFLPWLGVGTGYEWFDESASAGGMSASIDASGFEFVMLQAGADIRASAQFALGPFVMLSLGTYGTGSVSIDGASIPADVISVSLHAWVVFGLRGNLSL